MIIVKKSMQHFHAIIQKYVLPLKYAGMCKIQYTSMTFTRYETQIYWN